MRPSRVGIGRSRLPRSPEVLRLDGEAARRAARRRTSAPPSGASTAAAIELARQRQEKSPRSFAPRSASSGSASRTDGADEAAQRALAELCGRVFTEAVRYG